MSKKDILEAFSQEAENRAEAAKPPPKKKRKKAEPDRSKWITHDMIAKRDAEEQANNPVSPLTKEEFDRLIEESREEWENW